MAEKKLTTKKPSARSKTGTKAAVTAKPTPSQPSVTPGAFASAAGSVMKLGALTPSPGSRPKRQRIGRGHGSGMVKTGGEGGKGQTARSGVAINGFEGGQTPLHRRLPKRGFWNPFSIRYNEVNLGRIQAAVDAGKLDAAAPVTIEALIGAGVCAKPRDGVKILGKGALAAKLVFEVAAASKSAVAAIEGAGGSIVLLNKETAAPPAGS